MLENYSFKNSSIESSNLEFLNSKWKATGCTSIFGSNFVTRIKIKQLFMKSNDTLMKKK